MIGVMNKRSNTKCLLALAMAILGCWILAAQAGASPHIYWTNEEGQSIGRANLDGSEVNQSFISGLVSVPYGIAVDADNIFWTIDEEVGEGGGIGRANLDGSEPDESFITGADLPEGMALGEGRLYWAVEGGEAIGRANVDGTEADNAWLELEGEPEAVAVSSSHVYWDGSALQRIGRANLDGSEKVGKFLGNGYWVGVTVGAGHIYWTNYATGNIGRANLDGTGVDEEFITGAVGPDAIVLNGSYIYWSNYKNGTIGRAKLDGSEPDQSFITGGNKLAGLAVLYLIPSLTTKASAAEAPLGTAVQDTATFGGSEEATGSTITFKLYGPTDPTCIGMPLSTSEVAVTGNGTYQSDAFTPTTTGTYHWVASYSGNEQNQPVSGSCEDADETFTVTAAAATPTTPGSSTTSTAAKANTPASVSTPASGPKVFALKKLKRQYKVGSGRLNVKVPSAGKVVISGKGVRTRTRNVTAAGITRLAVVPKGSYAQRLRTHRRGFTTVKVAFTPRGGGPTVVKTRRMRLVRR